ncbi:hypothetical protein AAFC00_006808 [Neodothiora populina]|uniref:NAD(P)-binding protein n=1 Tax=Neodothiora populina TaxID=2781224 RepID=A0ABR3PB79_9PEZI
MPVPSIATVIADGLDAVPGARLLVRALPWMLVLYVIKWYFSGTSNTSERKMHGKVVMVTGGTSGIGQEVVRNLAARGAQIVLLTQHPLNDLFLVDYIGELRERTNNELITAEQVDLSSLHSIRTFATKWIDNAPPRRLDMIILCASTLTPKGGKIQVTDEGVEENWQLNYLANFHLLSILSPAIRAQPPDREVRILFATCSTYVGADLPIQVKTAESEKDSSVKKEAVKAFNPSAAYSSSKLALMTFALAFQKHLTSYSRPDKKPMNARVFLVDPGYTRTPGMRRYLTWGSLIGLALYLITYPFWWLVLKSPEQGSQTFLYAAMEARFGRGDGGWYLKECREMKVLRQDPADEALQKRLWEYSESMVQEAEKRGAKKRAVIKAEAEKKEKERKEKAQQAQKQEKKQDPQPAKAPGSRRSRKA